MSTNNTMFECPICKEFPGSHSFEYIGENEGVSMIYSCPAKGARYDDYDGIIYHISKMLESLNDKKWCFILDFTDFGMIHLLQARLSVSIVKLVNEKYCDNLENVYITNTSNFFSSWLKFVTPFICEELKQKIVFI